MAHHWVQPWQAVETHSPLAGPAAFALRGASAALTGTPSSVMAQPAAIAPAKAAEALMNSRLVSFMPASQTHALTGGNAPFPCGIPRGERGVCRSAPISTV